MALSRRNFIELFGASALHYLSSSTWYGSIPSRKSIITVRGPIKASEMGYCLIHEHVLVDFIGAKETGNHRWDSAAVQTRMKPYLDRLKKLGCNTFLDCTPSYLGKDPALLRKLSEMTGLHILTNTGYYGAVNNKYLPEHAFTETAEELANRWIREFETGIDGTGVFPGFIKISVNPGKLSDLHRKLVKAAAKTHIQTGLTICSHTGPAGTAFEELSVLEEEGVLPSAFVWVHAQNNAIDTYLKAADMGAWISLDGIQADNLSYYADTLLELKKNNVLHRVLISHDAGWYDPAKPEGGPISRDYTIIFTQFLSLLRQKGFPEKDIKRLLQINPQEAFIIRKRIS